MKKKVKMADIASMLDVSVVTVSKALSDQKGVSEEMREKIKKLADQLEYKQPSTLRDVKKNESYNIGILVPGYYFGKFQSFYWQMYQEVATKAVQKDCFTMLEVIESEENYHELPKLIKEKKVDGIILIGRPSEGYIDRLQEDGTVPIVCLDFFDEASNCDAVISDGYYGTYLLTNYLFRMGHEDIAYVGTLLYTNSITDRYFGYCKSLLEHGQQVAKEWVMDDRDWESGDVSKFKFQFPEKMPSAFVCNCDLSASYLIKALKEKGYRIPEDISVVGFDNYLYPGLCDIGITTYEVNIKEMARASIKMLLKKMNQEAYKPGVRIIDGNIVYKDSVLQKKKS